MAVWLNLYALAGAMLRIRKTPARQSLPRVAPRHGGRRPCVRALSCDSIKMKQLFATPWHERARSGRLSDVSATRMTSARRDGHARITLTRGRDAASRLSMQQRFIALAPNRVQKPATALDFCGADTSFLQCIWGRWLSLDDERTNLFPSKFAPKLRNTTSPWRHRPIGFCKVLQINLVSGQETLPLTDCQHSNSKSKQVWLLSKNWKSRQNTVLAIEFNSNLAVSDVFIKSLSFTSLMWSFSRISSLLTHRKLSFLWAKKSNYDVLVKCLLLPIRHCRSWNSGKCEPPAPRTLPRTCYRARWLCWKLSKQYWGVSQSFLGFAHLQTNVLMRSLVADLLLPLFTFHPCPLNIVWHTM